MGLRLKFNIVLGLTVLVGLGLAGGITYEVLQANAREEVVQSARIMLQSALAVRSYTVSQIRPLLQAQQKVRFLPQTVPAYAANTYVAKLQQKYPEYSYREATLNPTNPADRAVDWEADLINWFRTHHQDKELVGERNTPTGRSLYLARPITITNPSCLSCHGMPDKAPATMIKDYGTANGFGWKLHETVGAQIVSVPMSLPFQRANATFMVVLGLLAAVFALVMVLLNILLNYIVISPIKRLSVRANEISMGALDVPELKVRGKDEIATLAQSFNRMHRSLSSAMNMLDDIDQRTGG